jgi:thioredoxin-like negative regulator of GroEL
MDFAEFTQRADNLINRLTPRIDQQEARLIRSDAYGGDWDEAIDNLIAALAPDHVLITPSERTDLLDLFEYMKLSDTKLDGLTITAPSDTPPTTTPPSDTP